MFQPSITKNLEIYQQPWMRIYVTKTNSVNKGNPQFFIWIPLICLIVSGLSQTFMIKFSNIQRNPFPFSHLLLYIIWFNSRFTWTATNNLFSLGFMFYPIPSSYGFKMFALVLFVASCESIASCITRLALQHVKSCTATGTLTSDFEPWLSVLFLYQPQLQNQVQRFHNSLRVIAWLHNLWEA